MSYRETDANISVGFELFVGRKELRARETLRIFTIKTFKLLLESDKAQH